MIPARKKVLILGAGFAGISAARALRNSEVDVTIVGGAGNNRAVAAPART